VPALARREIGDWDAAGDPISEDDDADPVIEKLRFHAASAVRAVIRWPWPD
jgi:hypothetical protein